MTIDRRQAFLQALKGGQFAAARQAAHYLVAEDANLRQWSFLAKSFKAQPLGDDGLEPLRVALLSSFAIEFIHEPLIAQGFLNGLDIEIYQAGFAQFRQEILDPASGMYAFQPDVIVLALEGKYFAPAIYEDYLDHLHGDGDPAAEPASELASLLETAHSRCEATILVHDFASPVRTKLGILDGASGTGQRELVRRLNDHLKGVARAIPGVHVVAYSGLVEQFGATHWYDPRMEHYAQAPIAQVMLPHLAAEYMRFFRALRGLTKKCLVVDLDNTLWGGVIGEDGLDGILLGPNYPGSAFVDFQREVLNLYKRGVILAIASQNNEADVDEVFEKHGQMILKREHFAEAEIHWKPKSGSLEKIAAALNIGLEHIVFVDDNPAECEQVASVLPMVTVICLPRQPERFAEALLKDGLFDGLSYSSEDRERGAMYRQRSGAEQLRTSTGSLEGYYQSLGMEVVVAPVDASSLPRAAQLTQKTNQFNLTTIRYTEAEVGRRMTDTSWLQTSIQVLDCFGDNGIVGVVFARENGDALDVDTFLLSCRVIGRTIETAMLAHLCEEALHRGLIRVRGRIIKTKKNAPALDLYERHGFTKSWEDEGATEWELDIADSPVRFPTWLKIRRPVTNQ